MFMVELDLFDDHRAPVRSTPSKTLSMSSGCASRRRFIRVAMSCPRRSLSGAISIGIATLSPENA
jgi:hypothetical protein